MRTILMKCLFGTLLFLAVASPTFADWSVDVITGGIGKEGREVMARQEHLHTYNLKLIFTGRGGIYLSNVHVIVRNNANESLIDGLSQGPMLLTALPPGRYTVESHAGGYARTYQVHVGGGLRSYKINLPVTDDEQLSSLY